MGLGAASTAEWTGVPLTEVLDRAGVESTQRSGLGPPSWLGEPSRTSRNGTRSVTPTTPSTKYTLLSQRLPPELAYPEHDDPAMRA
jgi:DMSO/TMAO reductase YedYZ molybdopterin-dependent catalytic subunit